jgi:penicillin-binding protein 1A
MAQQKRGARTANRSKGVPPRKRWQVWLRRLLIGGGAAVAVAVLALGTAVYFAARSMPSYSSLMGSQVGQTIVVHARDGSEIVSLGPSYGEWLQSDEIPQVMKDAMVAVEDRRFYYHIGVDPLGLMRAIYVSLRDGSRMRATSTITQQLARNVFLNSNRTFDRKLREAVLAMALEAKFSKEQILELYLNKVYFGGGAYGVDSASRRFFSHPARHLSTAEAAIIAGMVKAPSRYSPTADIDAAVGRANVVLALMREQGKISASEAAVDPGTVKLQQESGQNSFRYFTDYVLPQLDLLLPDTGSLEPIEVWTTIDPTLQNAAAEAVRRNAPAGAQGALVSLDRDGAILALVGGTDYVKSNYNRATEAVRQPGSAWKLFVYLTALEAGYTPDDAVKDVPVTIDGWSPRNSNGRFVGDVDVRTAFAYSINTIAAQLGNEVGFSNIAGMARRFGITTPIDTNPSMVLGSNEVRVIDLTRAFASVSAGGRSIEPYGITRVETASGEMLYQHQQPRTYQLVPDYVAAGITDLLQTAVNTGTGRAAQIGRPVAGKTGTTSSNKDGWFVGFSSGVTTGVWMGRDDAKAVRGLQGGAAPARAFSQYMRVAVRNRPVEEFDTDLKLPDWQVEPDDEWMYGDPDDEYYYVDEQGNLIQPGGNPEQRGPSFPAESDRPVAPDPRQAPVPGAAPPPAASDEFLERATGRDVYVASRGLPPAPPQVRRGGQ